MIKARANSGRRQPLLLGDEPQDLARGRLLHEVGAASRVILPAKGEVPPPTSLGGEDAEWLVSRLRALPPERSWLVDLAAVASDEEAAPGGDLSRTALKEIAVLLASARRSAAHDLGYAFSALERPPPAIRKDPRLRAFREECSRAVGAALKARPVFAWRVALVTASTAESVEEIVAARWRDRLSRYVVLVANPVYAEGRVVYAFRSPAGLEGAAVLLSGLPPGAPPPRTERGGAAGRGALTPDQFAELLGRLRFKKPANLIR